MTIRLARHDEIVERMKRSLFLPEKFMLQGTQQTAHFDLSPDADKYWTEKCAFALDALLTAVVELGVGKNAQLEFGGARYHAPQPDALILQLEDKP